VAIRDVLAHGSQLDWGARRSIARPGPVILLRTIMGWRRAREAVASIGVADCRRSCAGVVAVRQYRVPEFPQLCGATMGVRAELRVEGGGFCWWLRVMAYAFLLTTDRYPPFSLSA
jgi:hypothetical protein